MSSNLIETKSWINPDPTKLEVLTKQMNTNESLIIIHDIETDDIYFIGLQLAKYLGYSQVSDLTNRKWFSNDFSSKVLGEFLNKIKGLPQALSSQISPNGMTLINEAGFYAAAFTGSFICQVNFYFHC